MEHGHFTFSWASLLWWLLSLPRHRYVLHEHPTPQCKKKQPHLHTVEGKMTFQRDFTTILLLPKWRTTLRKRPLCWERLDFPVALVVKSLAANAGDKRDAGRSLGRELPWRRVWQPTPVFLPGRSHGQRSLVGYGTRSLKESDMTELT